VLHCQQQRSYPDTITLDESRFFLNGDYKLIWLPPAEAIPERERQIVQSEKVRLTLWNLSGFHLVDSLLKGAKLNANYSVIQILSPLSD
jgi:hypothetical protein